ncbi:MAG: selenide, water dikinase SelD, partial [Leptospiraceae bacterium]|nr:selenide, water dikinase SelD [Leptospiraceae bacterium]
RCNGCGSKIGSEILENALERIIKNHPEPNSKWWERFLWKKEKSNLVLGLQNPTDSAILKIPKNKNLALTVDQFTAVISDPYLNGKITANHCLNDLFAISAKPDFALATISFPVKSSRLAEYDLYHSLEGAMEAFEESGCKLVGGHSTESDEMTLGFTCGGLLEEDHGSNITGARSDDYIVITKKVGTGIVLAYNMRNKAKAISLEQAIQSMLLSNYKASRILKEYDVTSCTDISGFGILGHLIAILKSSHKRAIIGIENIPVFSGIKGMLKDSSFIRSSMFPSNFQSYNKFLQKVDVERSYLADILFDPQTSGGLLFTIGGEKLQNCLDELKSKGYNSATCIGQIGEGNPEVTLVERF